ncbi:MAG: signal peptidase I [Verrucomicrobiales bacterium]|jgi:signal peptidase I
MFKPKYQKEGKLLIKGVNRFLNYRRDLLKPELVEDIEARRGDFKSALKAKDKEKAEGLAKELTELCEGAAPQYRNSSLAENIEVIFVAIAIALGIRAYIAQPFKIPTGSMQPTLNGIIPYPDAEKPVPGLFGRIWDATISGRVWEDDVAKQDERVTDLEQKNWLKFFTYTYITCDSGNVYSAFGQKDKVSAAFGVRVGNTYKKGEVIARGAVEIGDHVIVDKFSYHFCPPSRGGVFVFTTKDIKGIENGPNFNKEMGSQHYIKRLAGVPGDKLMITTENELYVNGQRGTEPGFVRVMSKEDGFRGYKETGLWTRGAVNYGGFELDRLELPEDGSPGVVLPEETYVALGDNSFASSDSRTWGGVPKKNLVGRAFVVYWPFGPHWGRIR